MDFEYDGGIYPIPDSLNEIQLQKHMEWSFTYGVGLRTRRLAINEMAAGDERDLTELMLFHDEAVRTISFYTGIALEIVENNILIADVVTAYWVTFLQLATEERLVAVEPSYDWGGFTWNIVPPDMDIAETMTYDDYKAIKDISKYILMFANGDWAGMPAVCAAYFRKTGEPFDYNFTIPGNERYELMKTLPLDYALAVAHYLLGTLDIFQTTVTDYYKRITDGVEP